MLLNVSFVVAEVAVRFRRELAWREAFVIHSQVVGYDDVSIFVEQRFVNAKDPAVLHALLVARLQLRNKGRLAAVARFLGLRMTGSDESRPARTSDEGRSDDGGNVAQQSPTSGTDDKASTTTRKRLEIPGRRPPPEDVAHWLAASKAMNHRIKSHL